MRYILSCIAGTGSQLAYCSLGRVAQVNTSLIIEILDIPWVKPQSGVRPLIRAHCNVVGSGSNSADRLTIPSCKPDFGTAIGGYFVGSAYVR